MNNDAVIHGGAYFLKAVISDGGRPKIIFRSEGYPDAEITITDEGRLAFRRAVIESVETAAKLAL
ncbi:hypothetical protein [Shinella kummerowiae]|uniref:hypothetical protein n=1 Tax=Shinella kummerowiae TaxID=417745 RepID=UPI0021B5B353|nr:hypothetical protein [Shinella kummerowiae]MCT7665659.1 hypothetical protein [Shinella kummerowiae]